MSEYEKTTFWKSIADKGMTDMRQVAEDTIKRHMKSGEKFELGGGFEPLSYYATLGYDTKRIEELTPDSDKEEHPILGMTYRVHRMRTSVYGDKGDTRDETLKGSSKLMPSRIHAAKRVKAIADATPALNEDATDPAASGHASGSDNPDSDDGGSDSSSSTSSSSFSDKKKKKKKKKKEAQQEEDIIQEEESSQEATKGQAQRTQGQEGRK